MSRPDANGNADEDNDRWSQRDRDQDGGAVGLCRRL